MTSRLSGIEPVDTRETRGLASEVKFLIDRSTARQVREWARTHLSADDHGSGAWLDEYRISSLYFDTPGLDVLQRNGSYGRAKYRVRRYGRESFVFLERKLRTRALLAKRRTRIDLRDLARLEPRDGEPSEPWPGNWFHARLERRLLEPACQVTYQRIARQGMTDLGPIRLTLDTGLESLAASSLAFATTAGRPLLDDQVILELKYRLAMPALFKGLLERFALTPAPVSKYRLAQAALGRCASSPALRSVPAAPEPVCA